MDVPEIDVAALDAALDGGAFVLDVREVDEYDEVRLSDVRLVPLMDLPQRVAEIPTTEPVYVMCAKGGRSHRACEFLRARGIDAVNIAGGIGAWIDSGRPVDTGPVES